jgi:predicted DNA-binding antitoxin AbrB/MazE fold protein
MVKATLPANLVPKTIDAVYANGVLRPTEPLDLAEDQHVSLHVLPPRVRIPAAVARRKVNVFACSSISCSMGGGTPELVMDERIVWRVPVLLTFPMHGAVGAAGTIDVDAETGDLLTTPSLIEEITRNAETLAARLPSEAESQS